MRLRIPIRIWTRLVASLAWPHPVRSGCGHARLPRRMPERFATRNDIPQVEPVPALDSLHWPKMPKKLMQAAVVHILLLHSCTVVCNLHCLQENKKTLKM